MTVASKIECLLDKPEATLCFAIPGHTMIDEINPATGRSVCFDETLEQIQARYPGAAIMEIDAYCQSKAAAQDTPVVWTECTEEHFNESLEVLPPAIMTKHGFMVGEPWDHHALTGQPRFAAYRQIVNKGDGWCERRYYNASRPMTIAEFKAIV